MSTPRTSSDSLDARIAQLAAVQHGAFTRVQVQQLGATRSAVEVRLLSGRWMQRHRGVYLIGGTAPTWRTEIQAAVLARPMALVSHQAAGILLRMRYVERGVVARKRGPRGCRMLPAQRRRKRQGSPFLSTSLATTWTGARRAARSNFCRNSGRLVFNFAHAALASLVN